MQNLYLTNNFKKSIYAILAVCVLFLLYPYVTSLGFTTVLVYLIQLIICVIAINKNTLKFTEDKVEQFAPTFQKDKSIVIILLFVLLVLDQIPILGIILYPSYNPDSNLYSSWIDWCEHRPGSFPIFLDVIATIAIIVFINYILNHTKDPNDLLEKHLAEIKRRRQRKVYFQEEEKRKIALYGNDYVSSCAGVVFSKEKHRMWIHEIEYTPQEILSVEIDDISTKSQLPQEVRTKTSTGSMIGRGIVGGLLFGPAGAIIGGATAKKKSIITEGAIITNYCYKIRISTSKVDHELISYESRNLDSLRKCQSLILAFVNRNK